MGLVLEEDERGNVYIVEIVPGGNASRKKSINVSPEASRLPSAITPVLLQLFNRGNLNPDNYCDCHSLTPPTLYNT